MILINTLQKKVKVNKSSKCKIGGTKINFLQIEWDARLLMERSLAIKSPGIQYHLAGTKKVQQALATPGSVERFIDNVDMVEEIKSVFAGIYSLDHDDEGTFLSSTS